MLLLVYYSKAQNPQLFLGRSGTSLYLHDPGVQDPGEERVKEVQVIILEECARAIKEGNNDRAVLWYIMTGKLLQPDLVHQYEVNFPITLQMYIDNKTNFEKPAQQILTFLKTKRI